MAWPAIRRLGDTENDPDSELLGGDGEAPLNRGCTDLETRTNILMNRLMCEVWTKRTAAGAFSGSFLAVCWSGSLFVAVGTNGTIQTSPQGIKWTSRTAASSYTGTFQAVCWSAALSLFVAVGATGAIQTSPDGTTWTSRTAASSYTGTFQAVCWSAALSLFVAVGATGAIQTSPNGTTWTSRTAGSSYSGTFRGLAISSSRVIAVGANGEVQTSNDGTTWTRRLSGASQFNAVAEVTSGFMVLVGNGGVCQVSQDQGTSWSTFSTGTSSDLTAMALSAERWQLFYCGQGGDIGTIDMFSVLAGTPSNELRAVTGNTYLNSIAHGDGLMVAVGTNGEVWTSLRL
jgi:hypothetical protein